MSCMPATITSLDAFGSAISRCATEYGGPNWEGTAMLGGATVLVLALAILTLWAMLQAVRR